MRLLLIHTGGTIGMVQTDIGFAPAMGVIEQALASIARPDGPQISLRALTPLIDSANATFADWTRIAQTIADAHEDFDGFIVTHGTDTMAFSAAALCFALQGLARPVVLTGSMVPFGQPNSDALGNLSGAIAAAQTAPAGVWLHFAGKLLHGARLRKTDSQSADAFDASASSMPPQNPASRLILHPFAPAQIAILTMAPGASGAAIGAALSACDGAVLRVFGAGTLPDDPLLAAALRAAQARGTLMIAVSQSATGGVHLGTYAAGDLLRQTGVIDGAAMTPEAAFAKLAHVLSRPAPERAAILSRNLCGESG